MSNGLSTASFTNEASIIILGGHVRRRRRKNLEEAEVTEEKDCPLHEWLRENELREIEQMKRDEEQKKKEKWEKSLLGKGEKLWKLRHEFEWGL